MKHIVISLLTVIVSTLNTIPAYADDIEWTGEGDGTSFNDPPNWSPMMVPGPLDTATFPMGSDSIVSFEFDRINWRFLVLGTASFIIPDSGSYYELQSPETFNPSIDVVGELTVTGGGISSASIR